jgi:glutamate/tyrosine decarboxylase-like PLP-dependent enzyme
MPSNTKPLDLFNSLPHSASDEPESFEHISDDMKSKFIPHMTLWQHPGYFAYFPSNVSHISIVGDMLVSALHASAFTWKASPAHVEIELLLATWLAKLFKLPDCFLYENGGLGHTINNTSEGILLSIH